jgi:2-polyprenyl-6-methoxyphenol hydroxylase-like FAD-dependent oxidoreductase
MNEKAQRVLVVGGGIGGMAAAIALGKRGVAIDLVEIDPDWKVYGAGITITGPTLRAFRDLGVLDAIAEHGFFTSGQKLFFYDGTPMAEREQHPVAPGLPSAGGILRPRLHKILSDEVRRLGANVRLGLTVERISNERDGARVLFSDGTRAVYDLVIGADGIYSRVRELLFADAVQPLYTGQMSWRVVAPRPADMDKGEFFFGHRNIGGIIPCSQNEVYAFILHPEPNPRRIPEQEYATVLRELVRDFGGHMGRIRDGVNEQSSIVQRPFEYALQPKPWHAGHTVLIGDAVHATTPHLASGAGIAVEDAIVLDEELARPGRSIESALAAFTDRRFERCRFVVESSVEIGRRQLELAPADEIGMRMGKGLAVLAEPI